MLYQLYPQETNQKPTNLDPAESLRRESSWLWPIQKYSHNMETGCVCHKNAMKIGELSQKPRQITVRFLIQKQFLQQTNTEQAIQISHL